MSTNNTNMMSFKERILHMLLFEAVFTLLVVIIAHLFSQFSTSHVAGAAIALSVITMFWNMVFNWLFDQFFTGKRHERSLKLRIFHAISFDVSLTILSLPLIAWILKLPLWDALMIDIGLTLLSVIYAFFFNWAYDHARLKFISP